LPLGVQRRFAEAFWRLIPAVERLRQERADMAARLGGLLKNCQDLEDRLAQEHSLRSQESALRRNIESDLARAQERFRELEHRSSEWERRFGELARQLDERQTITDQVSSVAQLLQESTARLLSKLAAVAHRQREDRSATGTRRQEPLYLDLMEAVLAGTIDRDAPIRNDWNGGAFDEETRLLGRDWPATALTMIGTIRLRNLRDLLERAILAGVPGDFIETGVWRGGACIYARAIFEAHGVRHRTVWVADSFRGLPPPDSARFPADVNDSHHTFPELAVTAETVRGNFARFGLLDEQVRFLEGWFKDTLASAPIERLAVLRLDGDMYESTWEALTALYAKVSPGGFVIIDDYILPACRQAVDEFRRVHSIAAPLQEVDGAAVYWEVPSSVDSTE
jgi:O-methyltransferase